MRFVSNSFTVMTFFGNNKHFKAGLHLRFFLCKSSMQFLLRVNNHENLKCKLGAISVRFVAVVLVGGDRSKYCIQIA